MPLYEERFPVGTHVQIASRERLAEFKDTWGLHHPLASEQLEFAGRQTTVRDVVLPCGNVLYTLDRIPDTGGI